MGERIYYISYALMIARVIISFFSWFGFLPWVVFIISVLDAMDGLLPYLKLRGKVSETKQKLDYLTDVISRTIFLVPTFFLPAELGMWFVLFFIWYYVTTIARIITGNPLFVAFTAPVNILILGVVILQFFNLPYIFLINFLLIGMFYELWWHKLGPYVH